MIAKGERPSYRLVIAQSGFGRDAWSLIGLPGVVDIAPGGRALDAARATIAAVLDVPADAFDLLTRVSRVVPASPRLAGCPTLGTSACGRANQAVTAGLDDAAMTTRLALDPR